MGVFIYLQSASLTAGRRSYSPARSNPTAAPGAPTTPPPPGAMLHEGEGRNFVAEEGAYSASTADLPVLQVRGA